jgi:hypothetical protein
VEAWPHTKVVHHSLEVFDELMRFHAMPNVGGKGPTGGGTPEGDPA